MRGCFRSQALGAGCLAMLLLLVNLASANPLQDTEEVTLAWNLKKGDQLELRFDQTQSVLTQVETRDRSLDTSLTLDVDWNVTEVDGDGNASIEQSIRRIRIKTGSVGAPIKKVVDIDTDGDGRLRGISREVFKQIKTFVGLKFYLRMAPNGKLIEFSADDAVATAIAQLPATSTSLKEVLGSKSLSKMIEQSVLLLPGEPISSGESWENRSKVSLSANDSRDYEVDRLSRSTLDSVADGKAKISIEIDMKPPRNLSGDPDASMTSAIELEESSATGNVTFDLARGIVRSSKISNEMRTRVVYRTDQIRTTIKTTNQITVN